MHWFTPVRNSIYGLLGHSDPSESRMEEGIEDIREAMLDLGGDGVSLLHPQLTRRIRYADDIQALWYLRGDLMAVLADRHGETQARQQLRRITAMFDGLLPGSLRTRRRSLLG